MIVLKKRKQNNISYSVFVIFASLFLFGFIIYRLSFLALSNNVDGYNLKKLASSRTTKTEIIPAVRGNIYSRNGDLLAHNTTTYKLIAYLDPKRTINPKKPAHVVDIDKTATLLAPILNISKEEVIGYLSKRKVNSKQYQTEFGKAGKDINEITKNKILDLNLPGIDFIENFKRYYPKGDFASYAIGYAKNGEDGTLNGEMGIEKYFDKTLKGKNGYLTYQKDLKGYKIPGTKVDKKEAVAGKDIYLTIDQNIQLFIEQAISKVDEKFNYEWFSFTVMDAKTGAILGTANYPSFDLNKKNITNYVNQLVSSPFEPGSTMKTYTYMAAMENGNYNGDETFKSGTYKTKDGTEIGDWNRTGWGYISYDKGYAMSSNVGIINLINKNLNASSLRHYYKKVGFGRKTGITLPNEEIGRMNFKYETEIYNAGFGQGLTTTPIQNLKAMTSLTNNGILLQPYIVEKIVDPVSKEIILENKRKEIERVASTNTVQKIIQLMDKTVNEPGNTGIKYKYDDGQLIGKTGTAQIANEKKGGYQEEKDRVITSFSGIFPKDNPKVILYVSVKKPSGGSQVPLSSSVRDVVDNLIKYYGKDDTISKEVKKVNMPNLINKSVSNAKLNLDSSGLKYQILGNGYKIIKQFPGKNTIVTKEDSIFLITNDSNIKMPNVIGLSSKEAKSILSSLGLNVVIEGRGYVVSQSILEGSDIVKSSTVNLTLNPKFQE